MYRSKKSSVSTARHGSVSKRIKSKLEKMREAKKRRAEETDGAVISSYSTNGSSHDGPSVPWTEIGEQHLSASAKKIRRVAQYEAETNDLLGDQQIYGVQQWCLVEIGQLNKLVSKLRCPMCEDASLSVSLGDKLGLSRKMKLTCNAQGCAFKEEEFTSPRIFDSNRGDMPFDVNQRAVLHCTQTGNGFAHLDKLCGVFGMPNMCENSFDRIQKTVGTVTVQSSDVTIEKCRTIVRELYKEMFPLEQITQANPLPLVPTDSWDIDDGIPWVDVSFDGTWQRRGHVSHYGVGVVVEVLTGYVIDYHVLSTYCHACKLKERDNPTEHDWSTWMDQHEGECQRNHHASAKAMEKDAALEMWCNSIQRTGLRYRSMLSDGDSVAFKAVENAKPYGDRRLVSKLECVNHVHKRMGTALRKLAKEEKLGGKGHGRLTQQKCDKLQGYFRGAVLGQHGSEEDLKNAIWASWFHCISTDEHPHHLRCPKGNDSWCFWQKAQARGQEPPPHHEALGTALSYEVGQKLVPLYQRMTSSELLKRILHGKTQNANESFNSVLWSLLPKTRFFGKRRVDAAVAEAVARFNKGNFHMAEVMNMLSMEVNDVTVNIIKRQDKHRIKRAEAAAEAVFIQRRRRQRVQEQSARASQEDAEGEQYGKGLLADM